MGIRYSGYKNTHWLRHFGPEARRSYASRYHQGESVTRFHNLHRWVSCLSVALYSLVIACLILGITLFHRWRAYCGLERFHFRHLTVNHSRHFVDPVTKCCTNLVESYWASIKRFLRSKGPIRRANVPAYLDEYMWRERFDSNFRYILKNKRSYLSRFSMTKRRSLYTNNLSLTPVLKKEKSHLHAWSNFWLHVKLIY